MTGAELMAVVGFFLTLSGAGWAVWWRVEGKVERAKEEAIKKATEALALATSVRADLADQRLHTAETYATKQGMQEQTSQLLRAIEGVGGRIDGVHERLDRMFENPPPRVRAGRNG